MQAYSAINGAESLDANRKQEALNAANVDKIMQMQRNQFLAQASYLNFDPGGSLMKLMVSILTPASFASSMVSWTCWPPGVSSLNGD